MALLTYDPTKDQASRKKSGTDKNGRPIDETDEMRSRREMDASKSLPSAGMESSTSNYRRGGTPQRGKDYQFTDFNEALKPRLAERLKLPGDPGTGTPRERDAAIFAARESGRHANEMQSPLYAAFRNAPAGPSVLESSLPEPPSMLAGVSDDSPLSIRDFSANAAKRFGDLGADIFEKRKPRMLAAAPSRPGSKLY